MYPIGRELKMKKSLVVILSFLLVANAFSATKKTGWELIGVKGKVKEMSKITCAVKNIQGEEVKEFKVKSINKLLKLKIKDINYE